MIPFLDINAQYNSIKDELDAAVFDTLASSSFILGPAVANFEESFANYCGTSHSVAVNSGTSALHVGLLAAGIKPGDEVITVSMTFIATIAAITYVGAVPVFVDVDPQTFAMDASLIEAAITPKTKAIMPVHLHGLMADMDPIMDIARKHGLKVIEDAAQSHGAEYKGRRAGSIGDIGCFSFYPGKNLGACGECGAVVTNNSEYAESVRMLRDWGQKEKYHHVVPGFNYRMDGIQGAALGVKLKYIEKWTEARRQCAHWYEQRLGNTEIPIPAPADHCRHVYHVYAVQVENRDQVQQSMQDAKIATGIHYPIPVHLQKAHADLGGKVGDFPVTEKLCDRFLSLPVYPEMTEQAVDQVATELIKVVSS
jgi:dTDP-4-amino-4,6-dideoxygalactose transaminase